MALDYDLDLDVYLETRTKHSSLYKWCLKERHKNGEELSRDWIPWNWGVYFKATSFGIRRSVESIGNIRFEGEDIEPLVFSKRDAIVGKLVVEKYSADDFFTPTISFLGSARTVDEVELRIEPIDDEAEEICTVWGTASYNVEDWRAGWSGDQLAVILYFSRDKFHSLFDLISRNQIDGLSLRLKDVQGFYSEWTPDIFTRHISVLANFQDQGLKVEEEWAKRIPTLGKVGEASLSVFRSIDAKTGLRKEVVEVDLADDSDKDEDAPVEVVGASAEELRHRFYERSLQRISKLLGLLIVIEILRAIF